MLENDFFYAAVKHTVKNKKGFNQKVLADAIGISASYLSQILSGQRKAKIDIYSKIANECGYSLPDFLILGRQLLGVKTTDTQDTVHSIDKAVQIIREVEQETGYLLNPKQREAVAKILREELRKGEENSKGKIRDLVSVFN
ncbi:helix-turn-helix domain-containing protein [Desulfonema magnum]|uniref:HTH domain-containing protein, Cro/C1-type n=1 Tax=Desulfonema magnum TaxID=45655 RepID=A0A975BNN9_9BACT|nr:helix-turn-helix domain-containing protein [Desulfonema magnum]QTA88821.1 HTH domain-containing protein, Cro/C1-type [Desulfonema magnum]